ncbi:MAG: type IV secretion system DNA-binding domain-containing protein [Pleurocapsa sp. SU_196_0]|nr:type IV secretion system DNA-binding domain-containing protein [Pleurocapsa sp. SU_196_0]
MTAIFDIDWEPKPATAVSAHTDDLAALFRVLPHRIVEALEGRYHDLEEMKLRVGRTLFVNWGGIYRALEYRVTSEDIACVVDYIGGFRGDGRAGIDGTVHRISEMRDRYDTCVGVTVRVGRFVLGVAEPLRDLLEQPLVKILIVGAPGVGKSTLLRDMVRIVAERDSASVLVVDTSGEIAGSGQVAHPGIGEADMSQVSSPEGQAEVIRKAVANHNAKMLVVDEIGYHGDAAVLETMGRRGTGLIASAHGITLADVAFNPALDRVLGRPNSRGKRRAPSTFTVIIEVPRKGVYRVHLHADAALDVARGGGTPIPEERRLEGR